MLWPAVNMLLPRKALLVDIFFILAATNLMIAAFALGCLAFYKQLVYITIGNLTFPHQSGDEVIRAMYIPPVNDSVDFNPGFRLSWLNTLSPLSDGPYDSWSQCEICPGRFVGQKACYYVPPKTYSFQNCFFACKNISKCFYLYTPQNITDPFFDHTLRDQDIWIGTFFKKLNAALSTIDNNFDYTAWDELSVYCAYLTRRSRSTVYFTDCTASKLCLCGQEDFTPAPFYEALTPAPVHG